MPRGKKNSTGNGANEQCKMSTSRSSGEQSASCKHESISQEKCEIPGTGHSNLEEPTIKKKRLRMRVKGVTRRGLRNKSGSNNSNFILLHFNIRGLRSKLQSLNNVVNNVVSPSCISLNEHGLLGKNNVKIDNFYSFTKNRINKRMGGVSLSVPNNCR